MFVYKILGAKPPHLLTIGLPEDICRFLQEEEETVDHILRHYDGLDRLIFL